MKTSKTTHKPSDLIVAPTTSDVEHNEHEEALGPRGRHIVARHLDTAGDDILDLVRATLTAGVESAAAGASLMELEAEVGRRMMGIGQHLVAFAFARACQEKMKRDVEARGLARDQFRLRTDDDGYVTMSTTFGPITFPTFAYRDFSTPAASVTRSPWRKLVPYHRSCRSSPLCLQWEAQLGSQHPFRKAEAMLQFFTRGVSTVEDTTIARHMLTLGRLVEPQWLYRSPDDVRQELRQRATRDKITGRPLIYVSSDAHALRRYVGDTWALQWKMVNGIRVWCEEAATGQIMHLGGEFTWGDCHAVGERIRQLRDAGILPNDDPVWKDVDAQVVFVSDGAAWLLEHIVPLLVGVIVILDPYHLIDWFADFTKLAFGAGSKESRSLHARLRSVLFNKRPKDAPAPTGKRCGHTKTRQKRGSHAHDRSWSRPGRPRTISSEFTAEALLNLLADIEVMEPEHEEALEALVKRIANNAFRIDYAPHLARGIQIGSGAMESIHRTGSQLRLKLPGARWLEESSQAVLQFRMLELSGRWDEFWSQPDLDSRIADAFVSATKTTTTQPSKQPLMEVV